MLSYIWQQHCRIIAFSRCLIVKCGMTSLKVVGMNILSDGSSGFLDIIILCQIGFLILEASKPALNHDIVRPAAFSIHYTFLDERILDFYQYAKKKLPHVTTSIYTNGSLLTLSKFMELIRLAPVIMIKIKCKVATRDVPNSCRFKPYLYILPNFPFHV